MPRVPGQQLMSGTRWFWQFYYIMLCFTFEFWGFTSDWYPLFQIPNSSPADWCYIKCYFTYQDSRKLTVCRISNCSNDSYSSSFFSLNHFTSLGVWNFIAYQVMTKFTKTSCVHLWNLHDVDSYGSLVFSLNHFTLVGF